MERLPFLLFIGFPLFIKIGVGNHRRFKIPVHAHHLMVHGKGNGHRSSFHLPEKGGLPRKESVDLKSCIFTGDGLGTVIGQLELQLLPVHEEAVGRLQQ